MHCLEGIVYCVVRVRALECTPRKPFSLRTCGLALRRSVQIGAVQQEVDMAEVSALDAADAVSFIRVVGFHVSGDFIRSEPDEPDGLWDI